MMCFEADIRFAMRFDTLPGSLRWAGEELHGPAAHYRLPWQHDPHRR